MTASPNPVLQRTGRRHVSFGAKSVHRDRASGGGRGGDNRSQVSQPEVVVVESRQSKDSADRRKRQITQRTRLHIEENVLFTGCLR